MNTKLFEKFAWEENVQNLGMPHFYLGKLSFSKFVLYIFLFPAFIFLGIGTAISIMVFICEKVEKKFLNLQNFKTIQS